MAHAHMKAGVGDYASRISLSGCKLGQSSETSAISKLRFPTFGQFCRLPKKSTKFFGGALKTVYTL